MILYTIKGKYFQLLETVHYCGLEVKLQTVNSHAVSTFLIHS